VILEAAPNPIATIPHPSLLDRSGDEQNASILDGPAAESVRLGSHCSPATAERGNRNMVEQGSRLDRHKLDYVGVV
jgi:hypothetical protein